MFTGIVTDRGTLIRLTRGEIWRLDIRTAYETADMTLGASVACNGICLSIVGKTQGLLEFEAGHETRRVTTLGSWHEGQAVNLERALRVGDELGGHFVTGHVDGVGHITAREEKDGTLLLEVEAPSDLAPFIATKGSITIDGVSLTVNYVARTRFGVGLIPITVEKTTLGALAPGAAVNLEIDGIARYVARLRETHGF
ncbi:MAG TPA: riboflavin synthase [Dongiaceae bacterium]|jgi:riboflavin synthase|nr:riboflavin synthase [Dongiaceae bacterium]